MLQTAALHILERGIRGKQVRAEYALLYSMGLDKNYIFVKSDWLIRIARDFYRHSGDLRKRYLSNYYYGLVLHNRNEDAEALVNYLEAESDGLKIGDSYYLGVPKAYPACFGTYDRMDEIRRWTDGIENLYFIGRNGMHRYNNIDHSMLTAMAAVDNLLSGHTDKNNIWQVNTEAEYHENK